MSSIFPSEELRAFLLRFYKAMEQQDYDLMRQMFLASANVVLIGTDPDEWWSGRDGVDIFVQQTQELGRIRFEANGTQAFSAGNVGWIADRPSLQLDDGTALSMRLTIVLVIEEGHWRIAQWHGSIGERDVVSFGRSLPKTIDRLERSIREDRPDVSPASAPDGTVTIVFTDIESSTVLLDRMGDVEFQRVLAWHDRIVREASERHRGFIVKAQGDGFMLAFPSAALALRACLEMRNRIADGHAGIPVRIRVGMHSGEAIKRDDDFYGSTVVIAARIAGLAMGGEILVSDLVYALARGLQAFEFGEARTATLKGLEGEFSLYPVIK